MTVRVWNEIIKFTEEFLTSEVELCFCSGREEHVDLLLQLEYQYMQISTFKGNYTLSF